MIFLLAAHIAIRQFIEMGTSSAFFTFISKQARSHYFVLIYWGWLLFQLFTLGLITYVLLPAEIFVKLFNGESRNFVLLALLSSLVPLILFAVTIFFIFRNRLYLIGFAIGNFVKLSN